MPDQPQRPTVSVIVPTYNRGPLVVQAVRSVLAQTYPEIELIVVDDGSTDDTASLLEEFKADIRYIRQENRGVSEARNTGIRNAGGEFITFLDSDDVYLPEKVAVQMAKPPDLDEVLYCKIDNADLIEGSGVAHRVIKGNVPWVRARRDGYAVDAVREIANGRYLHISGMMCRTETLRKIGPMNPAFSAGEDVEFMFRGALMFPLRITEDRLVLRRMHEEQTGLHKEKHVLSLIGVTRSMMDLSDAHGQAQIKHILRPHLAKDLSKLATIRANQGRPMEAAKLAFRAFLAEPRRPARAGKAFWLALGGKPALAVR